MNASCAKEILLHIKNFDDSDILEALNFAIEAIDKQIPRNPYRENENGVYETDFCPTCHQKLYPDISHCECGQAIDWNEEKKIEV